MPHKQVRQQQRNSSTSVPKASDYIDMSNLSNPDYQEVREYGPRMPRLSDIPSARDIGGGGSPQMVFVLLIVLLFVVSFKSIIQPLADLSWNTNSKNNVTKLPWKPFLGGLLMIGIVVFIANINDDMASLMTVFVLGLLTVYLVETSGGGFTTLFNWFGVETVSKPSQKNGQ